MVATDGKLPCDAVAKRTAAPQYGSPPRKARRSHNTSPKVPVELLDINSTNPLEQRLRFVNGAVGKNDSDDSEASISDIAEQMQNLDITPPIQELQPTQQAIPGCKDNRAVWRFCDEVGNSKLIRTTEEDGWQLVDEYGEKTPPRMPSPSPERISDSIAQCSDNPLFSQEDTTEHFQWIVTNLPYPASTYDIKVDSVRQQIVIRTSNKKYYKRIDVPELLDRGLQLTDQLLHWKHSHNKLVVSYLKPIG
mmetsp:Transcript_82274/g.129545  ORF Transcript_82274/g.129545 Transcript_82274/m.129545 type:complete len:249 (-) Transcript_82274:126-872(-)